MTMLRLVGGCCLLLSTTALSALGQTASATPPMEDRMDRLERLVEAILVRLDRLSPEDADEVALLEEAASSVRLDMQGLREQSSASRETIEEIVDERLATRTEPDGFKMGNTRFTFGGYLKADTSVSVFSDGLPPTGSLGRDFFIPSTVPVAAEPSDGGTLFDFNPRETRFLFKSSTPVGDDVLVGHLEFDFQVTNDGNEIISNSFAPRMRQAFIEYKGFTFGQVWSTFQDLNAYPDNVEFIGPAVLGAFNRQPMIRYTRGPWEVAVEQPEVLVTGLADADSGIANADTIPDVVARYTHKMGASQIRLAGIVRQLRVDGGVFSGLTNRDTAVGYGVNLTGKVMTVGGDDIRFGLVAGQGLGRYVGLAVVDGVAIADEELDPIATYSGYASYRHLWNDHWRSALTLGYLKANNPTEFTGDGVTDEVASMAVNLLYSPVPDLTLGVEFIHARRQLESGDAGTLNRTLFSARLDF